MWLSLILFVIRYFICKFDSVYGFISAMGEAICASVFLMEIYNCFLWKYNPFEKTPKIMGNYKGKINYSYNDNKSMKNVSLKINQTLLSVKVSMNTNEIKSNTVVSDLVKENDEYVLYYTYITNPKSKYSDANPIQYGSCRIGITNKDKLEGIYWTNRKTIGDISIRKI